MLFWWICGGESVLPVLLLRHLGSSSKKGLNDRDKYDSEVTHLEPDMLECEVKWALGSITTNKASKGDGIPAELFQILNDDPVKLLYSICW